MLIEQLVDGTFICYFLVRNCPANNAATPKPANPQSTKAFEKKIMADTINKIIATNLDRVVKSKNICFS